jgi:hypothetical protein
MMNVPFSSQPDYFVVADLASSVKMVKHKIFIVCVPLSALLFSCPHLSDMFASRVLLPLTFRSFAQNGFGSGHCRVCRMLVKDTDFSEAEAKKKMSHAI